MQDMGDGIHYKSDRQGVSTFGETACGRPSAHTTDDVNEVSCRDCRQILQQMARSTSVAYRLAGLGFFVGLAFAGYLAAVALLDGEIGRAVLWAILALPAGFLANRLVMVVLKTWHLLVAVVLWPFARLFGRTPRA